MIAVMCSVAVARDSVRCPGSGWPGKPVSLATVQCAVCGRWIAAVGYGLTLRTHKCPPAVAEAHRATGAPPRPDQARPRVPPDARDAARIAAIKADLADLADAELADRLEHAVAGPAQAAVVVRAAIAVEAAARLRRPARPPHEVPASIHPTD